MNRKSMANRVAQKKVPTDVEMVFSVKEIAESIGTSYDVINNAVKRVFPEVIKNGKKTMLSKIQVTELIEELKSHTKTTEQLTFEADSKVAKVSTELTPALRQWYTIEELASLCGFSVETLQKGNSPLNSLSLDFEVETRLGGYHNTKKFYSENVLKALKEYQVRNAVPNAVKDKVTAAEGNISFVQNKAARQTIDTLMDNPDTLQLMLTASIERQQKLSLENSRLKKEKESLRIELDQSREWFSIKRMEKLNPGKHFSYRLLKNESRRLGFDVKKVFDQNYGEVNAYHRDVWESLYFDTADFE